MKEKEISVAAKWWADQLRGTPKQEAGDALLNVSAVLAATLSKRTTLEQADRFEAILRGEIASHLEDCDWRGRYGRTISTDYGPDIVLAAALDKVGLPWELLPIKTVMWIDPGRVAVACGYRAREEVLYGADPNSEVQS